MKIDKAIEILETLGTDVQNITSSDYLEAEKLGIEALKVIKGSRGVRSVIIAPLLPGETKD